MWYVLISILVSTCKLKILWGPIRNVVLFGVTVTNNMKTGLIMNDEIKQDIKNCVIFCSFSGEIVYH